jgi:hypothetical protein
MSEKFKYPKEKMINRKSVSVTFLRGEWAVGCGSGPCQEKRGQRVTRKKSERANFVGKAITLPEVKNGS